MEKIEMRYVFKDDKEMVKEVNMCASDKDDSGLNGYDICEMFEEFMRSAGFSERTVVDYFRN